MSIWIFETEEGGAIIEIEIARDVTQFRFRKSIETAIAEMAEEYPNVTPTVERLAQPKLV